MSATPVASVIVRARDKADVLERTLRALRAQTVPVEIIVVDSGSRDGTLELARQHADRVLQISPREFTYGGSLNMGAQAATYDIHFALSAHCTPVTNVWVEDSLRHYANPAVAATNGLDWLPDGTPSRGPYIPTLDEALTVPSWGYSNHAGSWRASVWRSHPFRSDLPACEDKEWFWRLLRSGWQVVFDPALIVPSDHRREAGPRSLWRRTYKESYALALLGHPPAETAAGTLRNWWSYIPYRRSQPLWRLRLSPHRCLEHCAAYVGSRAGSRARNA